VRPAPAMLPSSSTLQLSASSVALGSRPLNVKVVSHTKDQSWMRKRSGPSPQSSVLVRRLFGLEDPSDVVVGAAGLSR
jgi:hypothetical protein